MRPERRGQINVEKGMLPGQCSHGGVLQEAEERALLSQRLEGSHDGGVHRAAKRLSLLLQ